MVEKPKPRPKPASIEQFLFPPTWTEWEAELRDGWTGPDGSSNSLDDIEGVRIGITSRAHKYSKLAANQHDWLYRLGRKHLLGREFRKAADAMYRDMCLKHVSILVGWNGWKARRRCSIRYGVLRVLGWKAWRSR